MKTAHFEGIPSSDDMAEVGFQAAKALIQKRGAALPTFIGMTLDKQIIPYPVPDEFMESEASKDFLCAAMAAQFHYDRVFKYAFINEVWIQRVVSKDPGKTAEEIAEEGRREYQARGYSPKHGGGRDEAVMVVVGDEAEYTVYIWEMKRNAKGKVVNYQRRDKITTRRDDPRAMESRFGNLLFTDESSAGQTVN